MEQQEDFELTLFDRKEVIKKAFEEYSLEKDGYLSFSDGKDSTMLHYLIDYAVPGNKLPRVFIDTGIEFNAIREFVHSMAEHDERFVILKPTQPIKKVLENYGYPFKSKEHSLRVYQFNKGTNSNYIKKYLSGYDHNGKPSTFVCPKTLLYQFQKRGEYNYSNNCCYKLKKEPAHKWQKETKRKVTITGMRADEGGNRKRLGCIITGKTGKVEKFHPLIKISDEFENWFIERIEHEQGKRILCKLYYPPFNFVRTGCKGCPFSLNLQRDLDTMHNLLPMEEKQCETIWKPVYDEYRRLGYRLNKNHQMKLF